MSKNGHVFLFVILFLFVTFTAAFADMKTVILCRNLIILRL